MPLWIVEDPASGRRAFCNFNEGLGKVLRFGAHGPDVLGRLARKVVDLGRAPTINTGIAHHLAGIGQIGAGITAAPLACFEDALAALADAWPPAAP
jgi:hypothetical protein